MAKILPKVRMILLCEKADLEKEIWILQNPLSAVVMPPEIKENFRLKTIFLYAQLTGGVGRYNISMQVRAFASNYVLGRSHPQPIEFAATDRDLLVERVFQLNELTFPSPELYEFQLLANHLELEDQDTYLSVLSGE